MKGLLLLRVDLYLTMQRGVDVIMLCCMRGRYPNLRVGSSGSISAKKINLCNMICGTSRPAVMRLVTHDIV